MKKSLLAAFTLLFVGQIANAFTPAKDIRAQFTNTPVRGVVGGKTTTVSLFNDGVVIRNIRHTSSPIISKDQIITKLSAYQMDRIERLIENSRGGATIIVPSNARCFAAPMNTNLYTADNGKVFLKSGHFCTGYRQNDRTDANQLTVILDQLQRLNVNNTFSVQD